MKIGNVKLGNTPLFLAPMEAVTDRVFRKLCKNFGADFTFTEFVSSDALIRKVQRSMDKIKFADDERPVGIQIYGNKIDAMVEAAKISEQLNPETIDINFGCPVKKIAMKGAGAGLLQDIPKMVAITREIVRSVKLPVTVKTRIGWDNNSVNIIEISEQLQDVGIQALTIHGRTRKQMYSGQADWNTIRDVKNNPRIKIPIIGNGDIDSPEKAKEMFDKYGIDGIMIGRAVIGNYWIFNGIKHYLKTGEKLPPPSSKQKTTLMREYLNKMIEYKKNERIGILLMRRHFVKCFSAIPNFRDTKIKLLQSENYNEVNEILNYIGENY